MVASRVLFFALLAASVSNCTNSFAIESNGTAQRISGAHSTLSTRGSTRVLDVCGEYPVVFGASDTGGSVCITLQLDATMLSALRTPTTLTISGHGTRGPDPSGAPGATFAPDAGSSPAITTLWMHHDCFCQNPPDATFAGTLTLTAIDTRHLAGSLELNVTESGQGGVTTFSHRVQAHFDASE